MKRRIKSMIWNIRKQKNNQSEQQEEKRIQKNKDSVSSLWDNFKQSNICFIGVPEEEEKEQEIRYLSERIMKENFPNLVKEIDMQFQEAERGPNKMDTKRHTPGHNIIKMPKFKNKEMGGRLWESGWEVRGLRSTNSSYRIAMGI